MSDGRSRRGGAHRVTSRTAARRLLCLWALLLVYLRTTRALRACPPTRWDVPYALAPPQLARSLSFAHRIDSPCESEDEEEEWVGAHGPALLDQLNQAGALQLRGFRLARSKPGFRRLCDALPLAPCADPLDAIGVRSPLSGGQGVYEAVNAQSLSNTYIGLHNDATHALTAPFAAFVCFQPAARGGEFLLADGRAVLAELVELRGGESISALLARNITIRVAAIEVPWVDTLGCFAPAARSLIEAVVKTLLEVWTRPLGLRVAWSRAQGASAAAEPGTTLQIVERPKAPINRHPRSGVPSFFSSLHSQSKMLQARRAAERGGSGFSGLSATDVFWGDDQSPIDPAVLDDVDDAIRRHIVSIRMEPGDIVLLDTYQVSRACARRISRRPSRRACSRRCGHASEEGCARPAAVHARRTVTSTLAARRYCMGAKSLKGSASTASCGFVTQMIQTTLT